MAWLIGLLKPIFSWFGSFILEFVFNKIKDLIEKWRKAQQVKKEKEETLEKFKDAVLKGDLDEMAKKGEDLLNGTPSK